MKNILSKVKISNYTYIFILICLLCGYIKNITIILTICIIHELGHILFIKAFHYEVEKMEILPFGGYTLINKPLNSSINKDLIIASAGIISELILGLICYLNKSHFNLITYNLIIKYNLVLIIFNLLPIIPLDGNKIMHLILEKFFSYHLAYQANLIISLVSLFVFGIINYIYHLDNYFILGFLFYQLMMAFKNQKYLENRFLLERYLNDFPYKQIDNHTKSLKELKKNVFHYFKEGNHYRKEKDKIKEHFYKRRVAIDK